MLKQLKKIPPLVLLVGVFWLGIFCAHLPYRMMLLVCLCGVIFFGMGALKKRFIFLEGLIILGLWLCAGLITLGHNHLGLRHIRHIFVCGQQKIVEGEVWQVLRVSGRGSSFLLKTRAVIDKNMRQEVEGLVLVYAPAQFMPPKGEILLVKGRMLPSKKFFSLPSYYHYLRQRQIYYILKVDSPLKVNLISRQRPWFYAWLMKIEKIRSLLIALIEKNNPAPIAEVIKAMLLGERMGSGIFLYRQMQKMATVHILVVSGFHVAVVLCGIHLLLRLCRFGRVWRLGLVIPFLGMYYLFTGRSVATFRAVLMAGTYSLAYVFRRIPDNLNLLFLAAGVILAISPSELYDIGFQLSFTSVFALLCLYGYAAERMKINQIRPLLFGKIVSMLVASFCVWLLTTPILLLNFKVFSPLAVLVNLCVLPLASLIILTGLFALVAVMIVPSWGWVFLPCQILVVFLVRVNQFFFNLPFSHFNLT